LSDAFIHCKFIGYTKGATPLIKKAGVADMLDDACVSLSKAGDAERFVAACAALRRWERELENQIIRVAP
jgi:catalase